MKTAHLKMSDKQLNELGITKTTITIFHVGQHKYTDLKHAVEEANRNKEVVAD